MSGEQLAEARLSEYATLIVKVITATEKQRNVLTDIKKGLGRLQYQVDAL